MEPSIPRPFTIRRLTGKDAEAFRMMRLRMLADHPALFGASVEEEEAQTISFVASRLIASPMFGGFDRDGSLCGTCGYYALKGAKQRHKGRVWSVYVRPDRRGAVLADALLAATVEAAQAEVEILLLTVEAANAAAKRLYERHGFRSYAFEPRGLKLGETWHDEYLMRLDLRGIDQKR